MFDKHNAEFARYMRNHQYEATDDGRVLFPRACAVAEGGYVTCLNDADYRYDPNLIPDEGLIYLLTVGLCNGTKLSAWYLSLYAANYTPLAALTAASYPATASEIVSGTEGYSEATRRVWTPTTPTTPLADNVAAEASFTIVTASSLTINGIALCSESAKGAITGKIASATKFAAARVAYNTDVFKAAYRVSLTST